MHGSQQRGSFGLTASLNLKLATCTVIAQGSRPGCMDWAGDHSNFGLFQLPDAAGDGCQGNGAAPAHPVACLLCWG